MRTDFDPRASRKAIALETASMAGHALMMPFGFLRSRHRPLRRRDLRTLVFVHGLGANRATFYPLQTWLRLRGHPRQFAFNHRSGPSVEALAVQLKRQIDAQIKGGRIDIIAHSLGGLIARTYLQQLGGARRVDRLITLGTPHRGTHAAMFVPSGFVRQLAPDGPFISHLNGLPPPAVRCTSVVGGADTLILPRESAAAPFGESRRFEGLGHSAMLWSPAVFRCVGAALAADIDRPDARAN